MKRSALSTTLAVLAILALAPPAFADEPSIEIEINRFGSVRLSDGWVVLSGTVTCQPSTTAGPLELSLFQKVGQIVIEGHETIEIPACDGTAQPWEAAGIRSNQVDDRGNSVWKAGPATAGACVLDNLSAEYQCEERGVKLRPSRD